MADLTEVYAALQKADAAGDTAGAKQLADYIRTQSSTPKAPIKYAPLDPTDGMSGFDKFVSGYGQGVHNLAQGIGQRVGLVSDADVAESRKYDAPLLNTGAGKAGSVTGTVATLAPTAMIPGANTMLGAGAIGAGTGFAQPSLSTGETLSNVGWGGAAGPAGLLAGRAIGVGYNALKSTVQPFFNAGQDAIAARTLQTFAGGQDATQNALNNIMLSPKVLPGVQPTTAELANNAGLSQLERQLSINPDTLQQMTSRTQANASAMKNALSNIAGTPAEMDQAVAARAAITKPLYEAAGQATVTPDPALNNLLQRPSMQSAMTRASNLAAERGDTMGATPGIGAQVFNGKNIQYLKMALSDMANSGPQIGMGAHEVGAVKGTLGALKDWTAANVPELSAADAAYSSASEPINRMQVGQALSDKLNPALADFGNVPRLNANSYAQAVRNGDSIAADVTGNKAATLASTLSPQQLQTINQIGEQLARRATATDLGRGVGSNTAQNLVSQNMLRQVLGPMGLPESWGEGVAKNTLAQTLMRPMQFVAQAGEGKVLDKLSNAALNPVEAQRLMQMNIDPNVAKLIWARQGLFGSLGTSSALLGNSTQ